MASSHLSILSDGLSSLEMLINDESRLTSHLTQPPTHSSTKANKPCNISELLDHALHSSSAQQAERKVEGKPSDKQIQTPLHLTTHGNGNLLDGLLVARADVFDLAHDVHALDDLAENDVFAVQVRRWSGQDEELAAVGVGARVLL